MVSSAKTCTVHDIFRVFTACPHDIKSIIMDVRPHKEFKKLHVLTAFNVRASKDGQVLVDYSQSHFNFKWSSDCWWGRHVLVYGSTDLARDHPVLHFLARQGQCKTLTYLKHGFEEFEAAYPFLCTSQVKGHVKRYPSQIVEGLLYLGDWGHATEHERLVEINVRRVISVHNHPENLQVARGMLHTRLELADVDSADISRHLSTTYEVIEAARAAKHAVLVHCGAGVSRSATLVMAYLMRRERMSAAAARSLCMARRSAVSPNDGFWRCLCALESELGLGERSDPADTHGGAGADAAPVPKLAAGAAGEKVAVEVAVGKRAREVLEAGKAAADATPAEKRVRTDASAGVTLVFEVRKGGAVMGALRAGPLRRHGRVAFGRVPSADVVLEHASVSRLHAEITLDASACPQLTDLGSAHGTRLADTWLRAKLPRPLRPGTTFSFGASTRQYTLVQVLPGDASGAPAGERNSLDL